MKPFELPSSLLVVLITYANLLAASPTPTTPLPSTGSGPQYATACLAALSSWSSAESVFTEAHMSTSTTIIPLGGISITSVNYIAGASTLCDGHPRVTTSKYTTLSSGYITKTYPVTGSSTIVNTYFSNFNEPSPTCSISPSDCDPLWSTYLSSLSAHGPQVTSPPLTTPPCMNQTAAASWSSVTESVYGCGECTIYGEGVQLVFWPEPTTVSRDMCASTPTANVTHYGPNAVITAYAGKSIGNDTRKDASLLGYATADGKQTIVADGHVFTSGTAYISISSVYAVDRCTRTYGKGVTDAILAMSSQSVLSLRYSQDHFQRLMETDKVTGYPVNYADFNTPIPWSAWNGQNQCQGAWDSAYCGVINENYFRPQLAIPPQITELSPDFKGCQMWYNGLWDPPLALTERAEAAKPTFAASYTQVTPSYSEPASPSSTVVAPTATATAPPTALPVEGPSSSESHPESYPSESIHASTASQSIQPTVSQPKERPTYASDSKQSESSVARPTSSAAKAPAPSNEPWTTTFDLGGETYTAVGANQQAVLGTVTCVNGGPAQTLAGGVVASYGPNGCVFDHPTTVTFDGAQPTSGPTSPDAETVTVTAHGYSTLTAVQSSDGGAVVVGTHTVTPGAAAVTLEDGQVLSAAPDSVVVHSYSTLGVPDTVSTGSSGPVQSSSSGSGQNGTASTAGGESGTASSGASSTSTGGNAGATTNAAQSTPTLGSGSSPFSAPALTSLVMVLFVGAVLVV